jgi:Flp pilus assembly protein TadG
MTVRTLRRRGLPRRRAARGSPVGQETVAERGAVTAEIAAALPALILVLVAALWTLSLGLTQLRCADAAREAARAAARGDDPEVVRQIAEAVAPDGALVEVTERDGLVIVEVAARVRVPVPFADQLPAPTVTAESTAVEESP